MAVAMSRIAGSRTLVDELGVKARAFAERFTWERAAADTELHLRQVAGHGRSGADTLPA
jgi:hypothetical protein